MFPDFMFKNYWCYFVYGFSIVTDGEVFQGTWDNRPVVNIYGCPLGPMGASWTLV